MIAVSAGLAVAASRRVAVPSLAAVAAILLAVTFAVPIDPAPQRSDWRGFAGAVSGGEGPGAIVVAPDH